MKRVLAIGVCLLAASTAGARDTALGLPAPPASQPFSVWAGANVHPAVARIVAPGDGSISYGSGTLVWADESQGLVVTNWHVINEVTGPISVHFPDGFYSLGTIQNVDRDWDLALIAIRKPGIAPVALAERAPRPGETLTIAGYGSGHYRAASGACTQYVAPGLEFPYEMVEVAVSARQGDSGGPIFNDRGELAGVLFGEGQGRTSGSYCGRVRWFLSSVAPSVQQPAAVAAARLGPVPSRTGGVEPGPAPKSAAEGAVAGGGFGSNSTGWQPAAARVEKTVAPVASTPADPAAPVAVHQIGWHDIAGDTLGEQTKTVLAMIGVLAIVLQVLRWLSREGATE